MKPHEIVTRLTELKQRGTSRHPDAGPWASRYADELYTTAAHLAPAARLGQVEKLARTLDLLITELATYRDRASTPPGTPLRTPTDDLPGIGGDVQVTITRGEPGPATHTALDRLAATLTGDYVVVISGDHLHLTARPASQRPQKAVPGYGQIVGSGHPADGRTA